MAQARRYYAVERDPLSTAPIHEHTEVLMFFSREARDAFVGFEVVTEDDVGQRGNEARVAVTQSAAELLTARLMRSRDAGRLAAEAH